MLGMFRCLAQFIDERQSDMTLNKESFDHEFRSLQCCVIRVKKNSASPEVLIFLRRGYTWHQIICRLKILKGYLRAMEYYFQRSQVGSRLRKSRIFECSRDRGLQWKNCSARVRQTRRKLLLLRVIRMFILLYYKGAWRRLAFAKATKIVQIEFTHRS